MDADQRGTGGDRRNHGIGVSDPPADPAIVATGSTPPTIEQTLARAQAAAKGRRHDEAITLCNEVLTKVPGHPAAIALLGMIATNSGRLDEGCRLLEAAVAARPNVPAFRSALAAVYQKQCRTQDAFREAAAAVNAQSSNAEFLVGLAMIQIDLDQHEQAAITLLRAIGHKADSPEAHLALAQVLLARGETAPGWLEYEWRNRIDVPHNTLPRMTSPTWNGMRIPRGRILLVGDQGYGDTIQFARYIPMVAERCQEIVLGCSAELAGVLCNIPGVTQCHARWDAIPPHAAHCRLSSLPLMFQTTLDSIPGPSPYIVAEPARVAAWAERLGPPSGPRIGLAWTGRPTHPNDMRRSVALERLLPLAEAHSGQFVCLQKPVPARDQPVMSRFPGLIDLSDALTDFAETAALIANLDLIISIDSAVAHLAGALGKAAWIMLAKAADWRWMLRRSDTPWYPTLRLFRQQVPGAWDQMIAEVADALRGRSWP
jgi:tetratricopeptide (TPR) repeat protein